MKRSQPKILQRFGKITICVWIHLNKLNIIAVTSYVFTNEKTVQIVASGRKNFYFILFWWVYRKSNILSRSKRHLFCIFNVLVRALSVEVLKENIVRLWFGKIFLSLVPLLDHASCSKEVCNGKNPKCITLPQRNVR